MSTARRGAHRSETAKSAILGAAATLVTRDGYDRLTIEGIASEAGVGKQTIYRWWPSKSAIVADCLIEGTLLSETLVPPDTGDIGADLANWLGAIARLFHHPGNAALFRCSITAAVENEEVGSRLNERLGGAPAAIHARLQRAVLTGQLHPATPVSLIREALLGTLIVRMLSRSALRPGDVRELVALLLTGAANQDYHREGDR